MNTKIASSLAAAAFTSACASTPVVVAEEFPPAVIWGQTPFPQHVADVRLKDGGEFPAPVIAGVTRFRATIEDVPYHAAGEFPPAVHAVIAPAAPVAKVVARSPKDR